MEVDAPTSEIRRPPARGAWQRFRAGIGLLGEGAAFLRGERSLWALALVPVAFATLSVAIAVGWFWLRLDWIHDAWASMLPVLEAGAWWTWIWIGPGRLLVWLVGWIGVLFIFGLALVAALLLANLASAPFLDRLSQRVEARVRGEVPASGEGLRVVFADMGRSFWAELQRLGFFVGVWLGLSLIGIAVPGAQVVTGPLLIATTCLLLPLDYAGFALDRRKLSFRARRRWLWANRSMMVGFGGVAFVACLVPGLNLLITPALVTAGTLLVLRHTPPDPIDAD